MLIAPYKLLCQFLLVMSAALCASAAFGQGPETPASPIPGGYEGNGEAVEGPFYDDDGVDQAEARGDEEPDESSSSGLFSLGLDFDRGLGIDLSYTHFYSRFFGVEYRAQYSSYNADKHKDVDYGADLGFIFFLANPTIVVPFLGLGPGYEVWSKQYDEVIYSDGNSIIVFYTYGASIELGRHFVLQIGQRVTNYLGDSPYEWPKTKKINKRTELIVRFVVRF